MSRYPNSNTSASSSALQVVVGPKADMRQVLEQLLACQAALLAGHWLHMCAEVRERYQSIAVKPERLKFGKKSQLTGNLPPPETNRISS